MQHHAARRLVLELHTTGSAPTGTITRSDGTNAAFDGWLQLLAALTEALDQIECGNDGERTPIDPS